MQADSDLRTIQGMTWEQLAATLQLGRLVGDGGWSYQFTATDVRWGARLVMGEIEAAAETDEVYWQLWANANRTYQQRRSATSFANAAINYSIALHGSTTEVPRRARIRSLEPGDMPAGTMTRLSSFFQGLVQAGAAAGVVLSDQCSTADPSLGPPTIRSASGECYWKDADSNTWSSSTVTASTWNGSVAAADSSSGLLAALLGAVAVVLVILLSRD